MSEADDNDGAVSISPAMGALIALVCGALVCLLVLGVMAFEMMQ